MTCAELSAAFRAAGAAAWGGVAYARLEPVMSPAAREKAESLCPGARTVLVAAFPYFSGEIAGNLSVYARGRDYHLVVPNRLDAVCGLLRREHPGHTYLPAADSSPLPEREAAWLAGLGLRGRNGLLILPPYGSYVFLGTILTDLTLDLPEAPPAAGCVNCGRCVAVCPTGALDMEQMFHVKHCLSDLTQKKGDLSAEEEERLKAHPYIWGCDLCQNVCPYNRGAAASPLPEFTEGCRANLALSDVEGLTNRTFREQFGDRAFAWRGPAVLRRNLKLKKE